MGCYAITGWFKFTEQDKMKWSKGAVIGSGSLGSVYLGLDESTGLLMAVKQIKLPTGTSRDDIRRKTVLDALETEFDLLKELQHPNIVRYLGKLLIKLSLHASLLYADMAVTLDSFKDDTYLNIFLEYVPGGSLAKILLDYGSFSEDLTRNWILHTLHGLVYLHEKDIIHSNIKATNILIDNQGIAKISDVGIINIWDRSDGGQLRFPAICIFTHNILYHDQS